MSKTIDPIMGDCLKSKIEKLIDLNQAEQKAIREDLDNYKRGMKITAGDLLNQKRFINENLDRLIDLYERIDK